MPVNRRPADVAFDRWLEQSLREQHRTDALKLIPEVLLKLLRDDA